ncbi:MAG: hypothetical protein ACE5KE_08105, partial [Methanosarcinales archaeon]
MTRKSPEVIIESLFKALEKSNAYALSLHAISNETGLHSSTIKRYIELINLIKHKPPIEVIETKSDVIVRLGGMLSLSRQEQINIVRTHYPKPDARTLFLVDLYNKGATSPEKALKSTKKNIVKELLKLDRIQEIDGKIFLTEIGKGIA